MTPVSEHFRRSARPAGRAVRPLLDSKHELDLARRAADGCRTSEAELVEANLGFVFRVAAEFRGRGVMFEDLVNAGNIGLVQAAKRFDGRRGNRFVTYAVFWVRKAILASLHGSDLIRTSQHEFRRRKSLPLSEHRIAPRVVSLDVMNGPDDDRTLSDVVADRSAANPEQELISAEQVEWLRAAVVALSPRERFIVNARFGFGGQEPLSLSEIGRRLGMSRERVRQIESGALRSLRQRLAAARGPASGAARVVARSKAHRPIRTRSHVGA
jgi:RNA polymerase primary sigma factor